MIALNDVVSALVEEVGAATGLRVRVGWISEQDVYPLATILMLDAGVELASLEPKRFIYRLRFQIDIWHGSAEECDRLATLIASRLVEAARARGWMGMRIESMRDIPSERVFRKTLEVRLSLIG